MPQKLPVRYKMQIYSNYFGPDRLTQRGEVLSIFGRNSEKAREWHGYLSQEGFSQKLMNLPVEAGEAYRFQAISLSALGYSRRSRKRAAIAAEE